MYIVDMQLISNTTKLTCEQVTINLLHTISNRFDMTRYSGEGLLSGGFLNYTFSSDSPCNLTVGIRQTGRMAIGDAVGRAVAIARYARSQNYEAKITHVEDPESEV